MPYSQKFTLGPKKACITTVELASDVEDFQRGAFEMTEWQDEIYVQMIRLEDNDVFDKASSTQYATNSFYYTREAKDGDIAGRVPVAKKQKYTLVMINYSDDQEQFLKLQYGAAVQSAVVGIATLAATIAAVMF